MTYQDQSDNYRDPAKRGRIEMCVREQGQIFANDGRPDIAALGLNVVAGSYADIDAIVAAACTGPNADVLITDADLLAAVQGAWPAVASALYGDAA